MVTEMRLEVLAPNRIDLAGGTTDLYPVYLFMDGGFTVNAAISVKSTSVFKTLESPEIRIDSVDLGISATAGLEEIWNTEGPLGLVFKALKAFPPGGGLEISTFNEAPAGSGLGASSALLITLLLGLKRLRDQDWSDDQIINYAADVETSLIGVPAGKQDHIAALSGGISFIKFDCAGFHRTQCQMPEQAREALEKIIILSYTGEGRFSGMNNWDITRNVIEKNQSVKSRLIKIRDVATKMAEAVDLGRWHEIGHLVDEEWKLRRELSPGVSTPVIESIMSAAKGSGAIASKICGAGGGGCMITIANPENRSRVEKAISDAGGKIMPFGIAQTGAKLTITE